VEQFHEADMIVVGDPDRCFEKMRRYADLGVDELICYVQFGHLSGESILRTIDLLAREVLPELQRYQASRVA
jgi:alkanesulfonate monooxygenase SsuD/methylene tetrahydromethanopterin reductase-like flavin-dependent oxidoreductase (luciferase family)